MQYHLVTLGCAKNVADSDGINAILDQAGMGAVEQATDAEALIVNTCGFLQASRQESLDTLRDLVSQGVKEIVLVAQDTTAYAWDFGKRDALAPLIERLCTEVDGLRWLR